MSQDYCMTQEQNALLQDINVLSFFVVDMGLFIDTHPEDQHAADYMAHYQRVLNEARKEYAKKYGPLSMDEVDQYGKPWNWECMPLPWEGGCC